MIDHFGRHWRWELERRGPRGNQARPVSGMGRYALWLQSDRCGREALARAGAAAVEAALCIEGVQDSG